MFKQKNVFEEKTEKKFYQSQFNKKLKTYMMSENQNCQISNNYVNMK